MATKTTTTIPTNKKIMCFCWNTESVRLCESLNQSTVDQNRQPGYMASMLPFNAPNIAGFSWLPCEIADFLANIKMSITTNQPDLIVIGFQEDAFPGSYFHSHLLPEEMGKINYKLLKRSNLKGLGVTTAKSVIGGDIPKARGLRTSLYVKSEELDNIINAETNIRQFFGYDGQQVYNCSSTFTRGKGATASYVKFPGKDGVIAIINSHLPFNSKSLITSKQQHNKMLRQNQLNYSNICFNNIVEELVLAPISKGIDISHVILMGDLNYRIWIGNHTATQIIQNMITNTFNNVTLNSYYLNNDELRSQIQKENIYQFQEGVNGSGPMFAPTCKMSKGRDDNCQLNMATNSPSPNCWKLGKEDQRVPSWCDRILYHKFNPNNNTNLFCTAYQRFDLQKTMKLSDHAAIVAVFDLI